MKILTCALLLSCFFMMSCEKNNCYSCRLYISQNGKLIANAPQPKICRVKKSYISKYKEDSARTWTVTDNAGNVNVYDQKLECTTDKYW